MFPTSLSTVRSSCRRRRQQAAPRTPAPGWRQAGMVNVMVIASGGMRRVPALTASAMPFEPGAPEMPRGVRIRSIRDDSSWQNIRPRVTAVAS